jgi:hypothetical protein
VFDVAITLLAWVRRYGGGLEDRLQLRSESEIEQRVRSIIRTSAISAVLEVTDYSVDFRQTISTEERHRVASFVAANYRPEDRLMDL